MSTYLAKRFVSTLILIWTVATFTFFLVHLMPGSVEFLILGEDASLEAIRRVRVQLGLDQPILVQYGDYLARLARLDFGESLFTGRDVSAEIMIRTVRTVELVLLSSLLAVSVGLPLGLITALRRNTVVDHTLTTLGLIGLSAPAFVRGTLLVLLFALTLRWLPSSGFTPLAEDPVDHFRRLILPALTLALGNGAVIMRMTRSSLIDVIHEDYVRTAHAKGLGPRTVVLKHALKNALIPVITVVGLQMGNMFGGAVVVEAIFNWPGLSSMLLLATSRRDYPVVQAVILLIALVHVLINLTVDIAYSTVDPRIRYS